MLEKDSSVYSQGFMASCGFQFTGIGDTSRCEYCHLEISNWTLNMNPLEIHSEKSPNCPFISKTTKFLLSELDYFQISESDIVQEVRTRTFSHFKHPFTAQLIQAGFFYCNIGDRVICLYCNLICQQWNVDNVDPSELHRTLSPNCTYVQKKLTDTTNLSNASFTTDNRQILLIFNESLLNEFVKDRLNYLISKHLSQNYFNLIIVERCWRDQLQLKRNDFVCEWDLYIACLILQKQIQHINGRKENIIIPSIALKQIRLQKQRLEAILNWKEDRQITKKRETSLIPWPYKKPAPIQMLKGGWSFDSTEGSDYTTCVHCQSEHSNWQPTDDPLSIHRNLAPNCSFVLAAQPLNQKSHLIKPLQDVYTDEEIQTELQKQNSKIILPSLCDSNVSQRVNSFAAYRPKLSDDIIHALATSGFFYTGTRALIRCYACSKAVSNFHQYSADQINIEHCRESPHCQYAQLMTESDRLQPMSTDKQCHWCFKDPKELVVFRCRHLAVCKFCAEWISTCRTCRKPAEAFFRVYL